MNYFINVLLQVSSVHMGTNQTGALQLSSVISDTWCKHYFLQDEKGKAQSPKEDIPIKTLHLNGKRQQNTKQDGTGKRGQGKGCCFSQRGGSNTYL